MRYLIEVDLDSRESLLGLGATGTHYVCGPCPINPCRLQVKTYEI